jgi:hypothetical protein
MDIEKEAQKIAVSLTPALMPMPPLPEFRQQIVLAIAAFAKAVRLASLEEACELFAVYFNDHSTRCAFVNRPGGACTCQIPVRVKHLRDLYERARATAEQEKL